MKKELQHASVQLKDGGEVFVLDIGAEIDAQAEAMLQALHSRSTGGIKAHLKILEERGAENFMKNFYVGYGHKSIGDCGNATVFVEGISMLAAKAIQQWRLYSGQEASTRYVDFSQQAFMNPEGSESSALLLEELRAHYLEAQDPIKKHLREQFPLDADADEKTAKTYEKAIAARSFDISRCFLPAGASTNIAWHMNLRQFADEIMVLRHHPLEEVRDIAEKTEEALLQIHPQSFGHKRYDATEAYNAAAASWTYHENKDCPDFALTTDSVDRNNLSLYKELMEVRPPKTELPQQIAECGTVQYEFLLDFGSFRDLQRHRALVQLMPLLTFDHGFESWHFESLPSDFRQKSEQFLDSYKEKIQELKITKEEMQYYIPMGYRIANRITGDLKAMVYMAELRATRFVHPTLVARALQIADSLESVFGAEGLKLHIDKEPHEFDIKRGEHDISIKQSKS